MSSVRTLSWRWKGIVCVVALAAAVRGSVGVTAAANRAPVVSAGSSQTITLPAAATLSAKVTDDGLPQGATVTSVWSKTSGPGTVSFANAASPVTTATFSKAGTYVLCFEATDTQKSAYKEVTITVKPAPQPNKAPTVDAGAAQTITLPAGAVLTGTVIDDGLPQAAKVTSAWSKTSGPGTVTFVRASNPATKATFVQPGTYVLRLTATDTDKSSFAETTITVKPTPPPNQAPKVKGGPDQTITLPSAVTLTGSATDDGQPQGSTLTSEWTKSSGPGTVTFANPSSPVTTATFSKAGTYVLCLEATDSQKSTWDDVTIVVNPAPTNRAPTVTAGAAQTITLPAAATLKGVVADDGLPQGAAVTATWSKTSGPGAVTFANAAAPATTATFAAPGVYVLRLTATDTSKSAFAEVAITVKPSSQTNQAPTVNAGPAQTITLPLGATLAGVVTDDGLPQGAAVTSTWTKSSGSGTVTFSNASSPATTATFGQAGAYVLRLTATDTQKSAFAEVTITVNPVPPTNKAPLVSAGNPLSVTLPASASLGGAVTDDGLPQGAAVTSVWTKTSGPGGVTFANAPSPTTTATFDQAGTYVLRLTATDTDKSAFAEVAVTVNPASTTTNAAPIVTAGAPQTTTLPASVSLAGVVSDDGLPAGATITSSWSKASGPGTVVFGSPASPATTATFSQAGTYVLRLTASDSDKTAFADTTVTVANPTQANLPPTVVAGPAQTIALPATAALAGVVTDDGMPASSTVASTWTKASGPGTVVFANAGSPATTATFDQAGAYALRLTATDTDKSAFAEVAITVTAAPATNTAPLVTAGPAQALTLPKTATLAGTATDDGLPANTLTISWTKKSGPGDVTFTPPNAAASVAAFSKPGTYTLELSADDGALASKASVAVTVTAPTVTNTAPTVDAGGDQHVAADVSAKLAGAATDDGKPTAPLTLGWRKTSGPGTVTFTSPHTAVSDAQFTAAGVYVLTLSATDGELTSEDDVAVTVDAPSGQADRAPPIVKLNGPKTALPGESVTVRAEVSDDVALATVQFAVDGEQGPELVVAPFTTTVVIPQVAPPGKMIAIHASARDTSNNTGQADLGVEVTTTPDTESPTIALTAPPSTAPGKPIVMLARAADNVGVKAVAFSVGGTEVASDSDTPYEATYIVPAAAPAGVPLSITARAVDFAGNAAETTVSVDVLASVDSTAPQIALTVPASAKPGDLLTLAAAASDTTGVASVAFRRGSATIAIDDTAPFTATYVVPVNAEANSVIELKAEALNLAGLTAADTKSVAVQFGATDTLALVTGAAYDDTTSLPIAGAAVELTATDAAGAAYVQTTVTDERGRFVFRAGGGTGVVKITKAGWTRVDRPLTLVGGQINRLLDARLTPYTSTLTFSPASGSFNLALPSQQGIEGPLPRGWSPVAVADVAPHGTAIASGRLTVGKLVALNAPALLALFVWDEQAAAWRMTGTADSTPGQPTVEGVIASSGQFVFAVADQVPAAPPFPALAALVQGVNAVDPPAITATTVDPQPQVLFYKPGVASDVHGAITAAPASSGRLVVERLTESYRFRGGTETHPEPFVEDLTFYQAGGVNGSLLATSRVAPSQVFEPATLERGVIAVELFMSAPVSDAQLVAAEGGVVTGPGGASLTLPVGSLPQSTPISLAALDAAGFGVPLPAGLTYLSGLQVTIAETLQRSATLSVPLPNGVTSAANVLVVSAREIGGRTRLLLVGVAKIDGTRLVSAIDIAGQQTALEGIRGEGRYAFVKAAAALGFAGGVVKGVGAGLPFAGALVTNEVLDIVALSNLGGAYLAAAPAGPAVLRATDLQKSDFVSAPAFLLEAAVTPVPLQLVAQPPRVTSIAPADGTRAIGLSTPIVVMFSEAVAPATLSGAQSGNIALAGPDGARIDGTLTLTQGNTILTFRPAAALTPNTRYTLTLSAAIQDVSGYGLPASVTTHFDSLDTTAPAAPAAGALAATIPTHGATTVSGTQGTAAPTDRVFVDNLSRKTTAVALVAANGSFETTIAASINDKLRLRIVDAAGNETTVEIAAFRQTNSDGSVSQAVPAAGGVVEGPAGLKATIREGTFPDGTVVTIKPVAVADFPIQMSPEEAANFPIVNAVQLDFGGVDPQRYVDVSFPAGPNDKADDQWIVGQVVYLNGKNVLSVADTAKFRDGRIITSSPPCPGILAAAVYGLLKSAQTYGLNYAKMYANGRYTLQATMQVFTASPIPIPYMVLSPELPQSICFPTITGRISISPNTVKLSVPALEEVTPRDREFLIRNKTRNTETVYQRKVSPYQFEIRGADSENFAAYAVGFDGKMQPVRYNRVESNSEEDSPVIPKFKVSVDPDTIGIPIKQFKFVNVATSAAQTILVSPKLPDSPFTGGAGEFEAFPTGGETDQYEVEAIPTKATAPPKGTEAFAVQRKIRTFSYIASPFGPGNLVVHATPATIDPTRAELVAAGKTGPAREHVILSNEKGFSEEIPATKILQGGFDYAFDGVPDTKYRITVKYDTRADFTVDLPNFVIIVKDVNTEEILQSIFGQSPPRDQPVELPAISNDHEPPVIISAPSGIQSFDPSGLIQFRFSESMNPDSLKNGIVVLDGNGNIVAGSIRVSDQNRVATFVPDAPLRLGTRYEVRLVGADTVSTSSGPSQTNRVQDLSGNALGSTTKFYVRTFSPRSMGVFAGPDGRPVPFKDVGILKKASDLGEKTYLVASTGAGVDNLLVLDATDPKYLTSPEVNLTKVVMARETDSVSRQRLALTKDASVKINGNQITGDIVAVPRFDPANSVIDFVSVGYADPSTPKSLDPLGAKILTRTPDSPFQVGSYPALVHAYARGVAALQTGQGLRSYSAIEGVGLLMTDVGATFTGQGGREQPPGYFNQGVVDVTSAGGVLYVAAKRVGSESPKIVALGPSLEQFGELTLAGAPTRLRAARGLRIDLNNDGAVDSGEVVDLAVVGGAGALWFVKTGDAAGRIGAGGDVPMTAFASVAIPGTVRDLEIDSERARVIAVVDETAGRTAIYAVDLKKIVAPAVLDRSTGLDDRIILSKGYSLGVNSLRLDEKRSLLYISTPGGLDIWILGDTCCDLGVDMTSQPDAGGPTGASADVLKRELAAIKRGVVLGLKRAEDKCGIDVSEIRLIESGSSGCLWAPDPVAACGSNYQPGVSDHDISTFMPDAWYGGSLVDDPNWEGTDTAPPKIVRAACVAAALGFPFTDPHTEEPKDVDGMGVKFSDISFLPNWVDDFKSTLYRLNRTIDGFTGDADNDLGMGRQLLVMKHLTEAYGVDVRGAKGFEERFSKVFVDEHTFEDQFRVYRTTTKIPELEGYEWSVLMQFLMAKSKAYIRVKGASAETSAFHGLFVKQYHTAAKAGIRAAMARMVSNTLARDMVLNIRRDVPQPGELPDPADIRIFRKNACLYYEKDKDPSEWKAKPCGSMEEYVAASAVRTNSVLPVGGRVFTPEEVRDVIRFYRIKADIESLSSDADADRFIATVDNFITKTKAVSYPIYAAQLSADPRAAARRDNRQYAEGTASGAPPSPLGGRLKEVLEGAKLHVVPHVFNHGFASARNVSLRMFVAKPGETAAANYCATIPDAVGNPQQQCEFKLLVSGGEDVYPKWQHKVDNSLLLDQQDNAVEIFLLKVKQNEHRGERGHVAFSIDLPDRTVKEAERENNIGGFFYYVLDPSNLNAPGNLGAPLPSPVTDPGAMRPDAECIQAPELRLTQAIKSHDRIVTNRPALLYIGQKAKLVFTIENPTPGAVEDVQVCSTLTNACYSVGGVQGNSTTVKEVDYSSPVAFSGESSATAWAPDVGLVSTTALAVNVKCEPTIVPLDPDPNPIGVRSRVMRGGKVVRYFAAVDPNTGEPATDVEMSLRLLGQTGRHVFKTNAEGLLGYDRIKVGPNNQTGTEFTEGIAIPIVDYAGADFSEATIDIQLINGRAPTCGDPVAFKVFVEPLEFAYDFEAGGAISAGIQLFKKPEGQSSPVTGGVSASLGGSFRLRLYHRGKDPKLTYDGIYRMDWERKTAFGFEGKFGWKGFTAEQEFGNKTTPQGERNLRGKSKAEGFKGDVEAKAGATQAYRYTFGAPKSWSKAERDGFMALLFPSVAESDEKSLLALINGPSDLLDPNDPNVKMYRKSMGQAFEPILMQTDVYKIFRSARVGSLTLFGKLDAKLFDGAVDFDIRKDDNTAAPVAEDANGNKGAAAPAAKPEKKEEESKPVFTASANLNGQFDVTYEKLEQLRHEVGDPLRDNPNAVGEKVAGVVHTLTFDTKYDYKAAFKTNLQIVKDEIDKPNTQYAQDPEIVKKRAKEGLEWLEKRLAGDDSASFDGGLQLRVFSRQKDGSTPPVWTPWRIEITFRGPKEFGVVDGQPKPGDGTQYSLTFAVEGEASANRVVAEIFAQAEGLRVLLGQLEDARMQQALTDLGNLTGGTLPAEGEAFSPPKLYEWFLKFVRAVLIYGGRPHDPAAQKFAEGDASYPQFYEEVRKGKADSTDFGLGSAFKSKFGATLQPFVLDSSVRYFLTRGVVVRGKPVVREDYGAMNVDAQNPKELIAQALGTQVNDVISQARDAFTLGLSKKAAANGAGGDINSADRMLLNLTTSNDFQGSSAGHFDWKPSTSIGPSTPYAPDDNTAALHKPHYGLGGFHVLETNRQTIAFDAPATLTLTYADDAVDGFAESQIRMFRWNGAADDWSLVAGTLDTAANSVTASVDRVGVYTLGVIMPAGKLEWIITGVNKTGSGADARTAVVLESTTAVRQNDGTVAPASTLMHIEILNPGGGEVLTPDADGSLPGSQVLVGPDGKVRIELSLVGSPGEVNLGAFSHLGTADGTANIPVPQQP